MWWEFWSGWYEPDFGGGCLDGVLGLILMLVIGMFLISMVIAAWWVILIELTIAVLFGLLLQSISSGSDEIAILWGIICFGATMYIWYRCPQFAIKAYGEYFSSKHAFLHVLIWIELIIESALTGIVGLKSAGFDFS